MLRRKEAQQPPKPLPAATTKRERFLAWEKRWQRPIADLVALLVFGVAIWVGWAVLGTPWSHGVHVRKLLYISLVIVAAFVVAAMTQRAIMGEYAITAGPLKVKALKEVKDATADTTAATADLIEQVGAMTSSLNQIRSELTRAKGSIGTLESSFLEGLGDLDHRLGDLEAESRERP